VTPTFFVLFPGVDPTAWVEELAGQFGKTILNGMFVNISMGEGQEAPAARQMEKCAKEGGWIMLQNVHLMQVWMKKFERQFEILSETAHKEFRVFLSAEPPALSYQKIMPESLMQVAIKVANEVPADMKSNLRRAWANFSQEWVDECPKPTPLKGCLFTLCFYHALVQGRRRFGQQGWSKRYSFNVGDLTVCAQVLKDWIGRSEAGVPWTDIRYILAGIMYGGHITDYFDRRCNTTYLEVLLQEQIFKGIMLAPGFRAPDPKKFDFKGLDQYIFEKLPRDSPPMFRMHPNAEIGYLSTASNDLFLTIMVLEKGGGGGGGGGDEGGGNTVMSKIDSLLGRMPEVFNEVEIRLRAQDEMEKEHAPFVLVVLQEIRRMNRLMKFMNKTMSELKKGEFVFDGRGLVVGDVPVDI
jgi:dynein heavy chain